MGIQSKYDELYIIIKGLHYSLTSLAMDRATRPILDYINLRNPELFQHFRRSLYISHKKL